MPVSMGNQLSTDYSGTVGPILMILSADPHKNSNVGVDAIGSETNFTIEKD